MTEPIPPEEPDDGDTIPDEENDPVPEDNE